MVYKQQKFSLNYFYMQFISVCSTDYVHANKSAGFFTKKTILDQTILNVRSFTGVHAKSSAHDSVTIFYWNS